MQKTAINSLSLAFCPLSNQECEWLKDDPEVLSLHDNSKLYMIAQRHEVKFANITQPDKDGCITFDLVSQENSITGVRLPMAQFFEEDVQNIWVEVGEKMIRVRLLETNKELTECKVIHWLTPDRLFMFFSHDRIEVEGLENYRIFTTLTLHYVGLSKKHNSFSRLFATAHANRCTILGNESQLTPTARLTDEIMIFMFNVEDMQIHAFSVEDMTEDDSFLDVPKLSAEKLAADAEKAIIKILKSEYNIQKYENYPQGVDGLFDSGLTSYCFYINECYTFSTDTASIKGARLYDFDPAGQPDFIGIKGDKVELIKAPEIYTPAEPEV